MGDLKIGRNRPNRPKTVKEARGALERSMGSSAMANAVVIKGNTTGTVMATSMDSSATNLGVEASGTLSGNEHHQGTGGAKSKTQLQEEWSVVVGPKGRRSKLHIHGRDALKSNSAVANGAGATNSEGSNGGAGLQGANAGNGLVKGTSTGDFKLLAASDGVVDVSSPKSKNRQEGEDESLFVTPVSSNKLKKAFGGESPTPARHTSGGQRRRRASSSSGKRSSHQKSLSSRKLDIWNRLMNNLSRAIDDVYFMSEVECSAEQVDIVQKVLSNSLKDFESLASSIESQRHFEREREEARKGEKKRMTVAWDVRKTVNCIIIKITR